MTSTRQPWSFWKITLTTSYAADIKELKDYMEREWRERLHAFASATFNYAHVLYIEGLDYEEKHVNLIKQLAEAAADLEYATEKGATHA